VAARGKNRQFPTAYKLKAIKRVERGEGVLPVAQYPLPAAEPRPRRTRRLSAVAADRTGQLINGKAEGEMATLKRKWCPGAESNLPLSN